MPPEQSVITAMLTATAFNRLRFLDVKFAGDYVEILISSPFDEEFGLPFTRGYIHGVVNTALDGLHSMEYRKVSGDTYRFAFKRV